MLDKHNIPTKSFRMVREAFKNDTSHNISLRLIGECSKDGRMYNLPIVKEVAILIGGDIENLQTGKDIIVKHKSGLLKRIDEHHPSHLGLQYPLLFSYGEDQFTKGIELSPLFISQSRKRINITLKELFQYQIHHRIDEADILY